MRLPLPLKLAVASPSLSLLLLSPLSLPLRAVLSRMGARMSASTPVIAPSLQGTHSQDTHTACFAAGCFWGVESTFRSLGDGIKWTGVGYTDGHKENPTYEEVCRKDTGHAEAVLLEFDPNTITYAELLDAFFSSHDPTQLNRQGPDRGTQYRTGIYYFNEEQRQQAEDAKEEAQKKHASPIVTEIKPASNFWMAEEYHQQYFEKRGGGSCH